MKLYERLGFNQTGDDLVYVQMEKSAGSSDDESECLAFFAIERKRNKHAGCGRRFLLPQQVAGRTGSNAGEHRSLAIMTLKR